MSEPLLSIIIPTYNAGKTLGATLNSLADQTFDNFEVIAMDGKSTDETLKVIKELSSQLMITVVSEKDKGIYDAMNKAIKLARGEWVYFLGGDDRLQNNKVLEQVSILLCPQYDLVYGDSQWMPENIVESGEWKLSQLLRQSINHQRIFYKRNLFNKYGDFNLKYAIAADHAFNIKLFCAPSVKSKYQNTLIAVYHSNGFSANKIDDAFWADWKTNILSNFRNILPKREIYLSLGWYCWYNIQQKKYSQAVRIFLEVYLHTFSAAFVKHTVSQLVKAVKKISAG